MRTGLRRLAIRGACGAALGRGGAVQALGDERPANSDTLAGPKAAATGRPVQQRGVARRKIQASVAAVSYVFTGTRMRPCTTPGPTRIQGIWISASELLP